MKSQPNNSTDSRRAGFTLVEMLVSVALVLLMMTMFARVFQIATESVATQQAISENDQKARTLVTIIRSDIAKRTFRNMVPYFPGELEATSPVTFADRTGYFYLSTNNPVSGLDDLLQFTMHADQTRENSDTTKFFGRADQLIDRTVAIAGQTLANNPNQPEVDDGTLATNFTGSSPAAQVSYFIRNGDLYRRVLLLREPLRSGGHDLDPQPKAGSGVDYFSGYTDNTSAATRISTFDGLFHTLTAGTTDDYYNLFDYAAVRETYRLDSTDPSTEVGVARMVGVGALSNDQTGGGNFALGKPHYRWGFNRRTGLSREHLSSGGVFMGRFLHAETSATNFNWPQRPSYAQGTTTPLWTDSDPATVDGDPTEIVHPFVMNGNGVITDFDEVPGAGVGRGGPRAVEDLLMPNVHEFRVEFWDERIQDYLPIGHTSTTTIAGVLQPGDLHLARLGPTRAVQTPAATGTGAVANSALGGPMGTSPRRAFDTWHSSMAGLPQAAYWAPFQPCVYTPPTLANGGPTPNVIPMEAGNRGYYTVGVNYAVGDVVFAFDDNSGPAGMPGVPNGVFDVHAASTDSFDQTLGFHRAFRCIAVNDLDGSGDINTSPVAGNPILGVPSVTPGQKITDNEVQWEVIDNTRPIRSMRITIRFQNQKSQEMRQLTIVVPLTDET